MNLDSSACFCVDAGRVLAENLDGEVVLLDLESGNYYSVDGGGTEMWELVSRGHALGRVVDLLAARFGEERGVVEAAVRRFLGELLAERLIETAIESPSAAAEPAWAPGIAPGGFRQPVLHKYTDMQDLLLLDPIHEVDDAGWPRKKPVSSEPRG